MESEFLTNEQVETVKVVLEYLNEEYNLKQMLNYVTDLNITQVTFLEMAEFFEVLLIEDSEITIYTKSLLMFMGLSNLGDNLVRSCVKYVLNTLMEAGYTKIPPVKPKTNNPVLNQIYQIYITVVSAITVIFMVNTTNICRDGNRLISPVYWGWQIEDILEPFDPKHSYLKGMSKDWITKFWDTIKDKVDGTIWDDFMNYMADNQIFEDTKKARDCTIC